MELIDYAHLTFHTTPAGLFAESRRAGMTEIERIPAIGGFAINTSDGQWDFSVVVRDDGRIVNGYSQPRVDGPRNAPEIAVKQKDLQEFAGLVLKICQQPLENVSHY